MQANTNPMPFVNTIIYNHILDSLADKTELEFSSAPLSDAEWESLLKELPKAVKLNKLKITQLTMDRLFQLQKELPDFLDSIRNVDLSSEPDGPSRRNLNLDDLLIPNIYQPHFIDHSLGPFTDKTELDFSKTQFSAAGWEILINDLTQAENVKSLKIAYLTPDRLISLGRLSPAFFSRLETLELTGLKMEMDMNLLIVLLNQAKNLTALALENMEIDFNHLTLFLKNIKLSLRSLSLASNNLDAKCLSFMFPYFQVGQPLCTLSRLDLQKNKITHIETIFLLAAIHSPLNVLILAENRLRAEVLQNLTNGLPSNEHKAFRIDLYPQRTFPSPDFFALEEDLKQFKIQTNLPKELVRYTHRETPLPKPTPATFIAAIIQKLLTQREITPPLIGEINQIFGNLNYIHVWNQLLELTLRRQFTPVDVTPDGNCLFEAVARHVLMPQEVLRTLVVYQEKLNRDFFALFFEEQDDSGFDTHLTSIAKNYVWGGQIELAAMQELLGRPLLVYNARNPLRVANGKLLPPDICIHGVYNESSNPICLFNMIRPKPPEEIQQGEPPFAELHYQALFPKDADRIASCMWPAKFQKPPENDTPAHLFNDQTVTIENGIIRLFNFIKNRTLKLENLTITSLSGLKALEEWLPPSGGLIESLHLSNVTFSDECWTYFLQIISGKSIPFFHLSPISTNKMRDLTSHFFKEVSHLDLSREAVENPGEFIPPLINLLAKTRFKTLDLSGRNLGNALLEPLFNLPDMFHRRIDLTRNGITDLTPLSLLPPKTDLRNNSVQARQMISYLQTVQPVMELTKEVLERLLPQSEEYALEDSKEINALFNVLPPEFSHYRIVDQFTNDNFWETLSRQLEGFPNPNVSVENYFTSKGYDKEFIKSLTKTPLQHTTILLLFLPEIFSREIRVISPGKSPSVYKPNETTSHPPFYVYRNEEEELFTLSGLKK